MKPLCILLLLLGFACAQTHAADPDPQYDTVHSTYNTYVNVIDFGATGIGTNDDTAAINAAISALGAEGGCVFFPKGTYYLSTNTPGSVTIGGTGYKYYIEVKNKRNVTLVGTGESTRIRVNTGTGSYSSNDPNLIAIITSTNCTVKNIRLTGASKTYNGGVGDQRTGSGIFVYGSANTRITDTYIEEVNSGIGAWISPWCKYTENHICGNVAQAAIELYDNDAGSDSNDHTIITGNTIDGGTSETISMGIRVDAKYAVVANNTIRGCSAEPIVIEGNKSDYLSITANTVEQNTSPYGIAPRNMEHSVIAANTVKGGSIWSDSTGTAGLSVSKNITTANAITPVAYNGIYVASTSGTYATNNLINGNLIDAPSGLYGVQVVTPNSLIIGNLTIGGDIGVVPDGDDILTIGNYAHRPVLHGVYTGHAAAIVNDNFVLGTATSGGRGIFVNATSNTGIANNNESRGFALGDYLGTGSAYGYQSKLSLKLAPTTGADAVEGSIYYDSTAHKLKIYDGTTWQTAW